MQLALGVRNVTKRQRERHQLRFNKWADVLRDIEMLETQGYDHAWRGNLSLGQICNHLAVVMEGTIKQEGAKLPGHKNLKSIKGIGDLGATILLSVIGDVNDFASEGKLAAYFGIVPRVSNSNETERSGRITKRGTKLGRTTLVQCALIAKRYSPYLDKFYQRIKTRRGTGKAIIALAKKFLGIIYNTLKEDWVFVDFPNFELATE